MFCPLLKRSPLLHIHTRTHIRSHSKVFQEIIKEKLISSLDKLVKDSWSSRVDVTESAGVRIR